MVGRLARRIGALVLGVGGKFASEPILFVTAAIIGLTAYRDAAAGGIGMEDAIIYGVEAVLGALGRELVWPSVKVDSDGHPLETVPAPYIPGDDPA